MQYCNIISLDNNNSVKFTSSRGDNSTTNDSMVMKIAHAQLHMYTNIMYKFWSSTCKTVEEKLQTKLCPQTDGRTDVDYIVGKGKKWWLNQHFFLFPLCFQNFSSLKSSNLYHTLIILTPPEGKKNLLKTLQEKKKMLVDLTLCYVHTQLFLALYMCVFIFGFPCSYF